MSDKPPLLFVELEDWEKEYLHQHCGQECSIHSTSQRLERLSPDQLPAETEILSTFIHSECTGAQLDRLPRLRAIATRSTGYDHIDSEYCRRRGITVCNVPTYGANTVAEHTFGLILALTRKIHRSLERTLRGDFSIEGLRGTDLQGKTFGCLGTGDIGRCALRIARGFDMRRIAFDVRPDERAASELQFKYVDFETLLRESHILSLHLPLNNKTRHIINSDALAKLPAGAIVVNTARGGLIDPQALLEALKSGHLGGAALDVLEGEKAVGEEAELLASSYDLDSLRAVVRNHALLQLPNVIITPHVAFNSVEAVQRILDTTLDNIHAFLAGKPMNVV